MREKLVALHLWEEKDVRNPEADVSSAWAVLSRLGAPYRYGGRSLDGQVEILVLSPVTGDVVASGRGRTSAQAMCHAAATARTRSMGALIKTEQTSPLS